MRALYFESRGFKGAACPFVISSRDRDPGVEKSFSNLLYFSGFILRFHPPVSSSGLLAFARPGV
jgi:hypothetical protein